MTTENKISKAGSNIGGPALGNALAYFGLWYAQKEYGIVFDDAEMAMAMAGSIVISALFYLNTFFSTLVRGIVYVFNRVFPEKK